MSATPVPELSTARLRLRFPLESDLPDLLPIFTFQRQPATSLEDARQKLRQIEENVQSGKSLYWGLALRESNRMIGSCGFFRGFANASGEIGYSLRQEYRGQGYMLEAVLALVEYGFSTLQLRQIMAYTDPNNTASARLLLRAGFTEVPPENSADRAFRLLPPGP